MKDKYMKKIEKMFDKLYKNRDSGKIHVPVQMKDGYIVYVGAIKRDKDSIIFGQLDELFDYDTIYPFMKTKAEYIVVLGEAQALEKESSKDVDYVGFTKLKDGTMFVYTDFFAKDGVFDFFLDNKRVVVGVRDENIDYMKKLSYEELEQIDW